MLLGLILLLLDLNCIFENISHLQVENFYLVPLIKKGGRYNSDFF